MIAFIRNLYELLEELRPAFVIQVAHYHYAIGEPRCRVGLPIASKKPWQVVKENSLAGISRVSKPLRKPADSLVGMDAELKSRIDDFWNQSLKCNLSRGVFHQKLNVHTQRCSR